MGALSTESSDDVDDSDDVASRASWMPHTSAAGAARAPLSTQSHCLCGSLREV